MELFWIKLPIIYINLHSLNLLSVLSVYFYGVTKTEIMKYKTLTVLIAFCLTSFASCSQENKTIENNSEEVSKTIKTEPHRYGGWYCPDNLYGFPAVDIVNWKNVPAVNGRMATKEETQNGTALIFVDTENYPNAKPLDLVMPKLAKFYNYNSKREDLVIVIQAINVDNDSVVGFRFLNGGNGSARLNEVSFLTDKEIKTIPTSRYVTLTLNINATKDVIWEVLTNTENLGALQPIFEKENKLTDDWRKKTNVNYYYPITGFLTSSYAGLMYGSYYIQNDYDHLQYTEKFFLFEDEETKYSELKIACGPYGDDFEAQNMMLNEWAQKVKELSEKE